jgi:hypothetical protein
MLDDGSKLSKRSVKHMLAKHPLGEKSGSLSLP